MRHYWYTIMPFAIDPMIPWFEILIFVLWNWPSWNGTCHARPVKDTRSSPLATSLTPRPPPWLFALGRLGWDLGLSSGTANCFLLFWMFCDVLCGLDSARTSNITGMYWGPMAPQVGQPVSQAWPSHPITGGSKFGDNPSCGSWFSTHQ